MLTRAFGMVKKVLYSFDVKMTYRKITYISDFKKKVMFDMCREVAAD